MSGGAVVSSIALLCGHGEDLIDLYNIFSGLTRRAYLEKNSQLVPYGLKLMSNPYLLLLRVKIGRVPDSGYVPPGLLNASHSWDTYRLRLGLERQLTRQLFSICDAVHRCLHAV